MASEFQGRGDLVALAERCFDRNRHPLCGKADGVNALGWANGYSRYLEIATPTTGGRFAAVCRRQEGDGGASCLQRVVAAGKRFDVIFTMRSAC